MDISPCSEASLKCSIILSFVIFCVHVNMCTLCPHLHIYHYPLLLTNLSACGSKLLFCSLDLFLKTSLASQEEAGEWRDHNKIASAAASYCLPQLCHHNCSICGNNTKGRDILLLLCLSSLLHQDIRALDETVG